MKKISVKNAELAVFRPGQFAPGILKSLVNLSKVKMGGQASITVAKDIRVLQDASEATSTARTNILEAHSKKDENGKPVVDKMEYVFESDVDRQKAVEEIGVMMDAFTEIELRGLPESVVERFDNVAPEVIHVLIEKGYIS